MKKFILSAAALLLAAPGLTAQEEEIEFGWDSHIVQRVGTEVTPNGNFRRDTNRFDMTVPMFIQTGEDGSGFTVRGMGQIFAPRWFYPIYDPYYNGETPETNDRDQTYIDQFKGVQNWQLTDIQLSVFQNSDRPTNSIAQIAFFRMDTDYSKSANRDSILRWKRTDLEENNRAADPYIMDQSELDGTVDDRGAIVPTEITFDPPLEFTKEQSAMVLYINDFADTVHQPIGFEGDARDWQRLIGYMEYQSGQGTQASPFSNPVPASMVHGVFMRRSLGGDPEGGDDTVAHTYSLSVGSIPARINFNVLWFGVVELDASDVPEITSSVKYHFGEDANEQGLQNVRPNPVREEAVIPFSLTEVSNVTIELYTVDGQKVETLLDKRYVPGKYTVTINSADLQSGPYLVRMTANEKVYSMKFNVTK